MADMLTSPVSFKFLGGWLCLDFTNTQNWGRPNPAQERFKGYPDLVWWNYQVGALTAQQTQQLLREADHRPADAAATFKQGLELRQIIHQVFSAIARGLPPEAVDLAALNPILTQILAQSRLVPAAEGFVWAWAGDEQALERVLWPVVWSAAELLTSEKLARLGQCAGESCGWLFIDVSRNHSRRWCEMQHCGNRAKNRQYYRRKTNR